MTRILRPCGTTRSVGTLGTVRRKTVRGVQARMEVKEEEMLELQKLYQSVREKIQQSEKILNLTSSFHHTAKQVRGTGSRLSFGFGNIQEGFPGTFP